MCAAVILTPTTRSFAAALTPGGRHTSAGGRMLSTSPMAHVISSSLNFGFFMTICSVKTVRSRNSSS